MFSWSETLNYLKYQAHKAATVIIRREIRFFAKHIVLLKTNDGR